MEEPISPKVFLACGAEAYKETTSPRGKLAGDF